jgi:Mn-containing catalase
MFVENPISAVRPHLYEEQEMPLENSETGAFIVLRNAIQMEIEGKDFFERAAGMVKHQRSKDTFTSLVKQEQRHVNILGEELNRLEHGEEWASLEDMKRSAPEFPRVSVFQDKAFKHLKLSPDAGELEVLKVGMDVEQKSIEYYRDAGSRTGDAKAKEVFSWLVGEEAGHLTILKAEYENRTRSGFYYDNMEFSLETF